MNASATGSSAARQHPRERLLGTASRLFYLEGIRAIGVDRLVAEANVTKATFYRHFDGKDDLVRAYLKAFDEEIRRRYRAAAETVEFPANLLRGLARGIADEVCGPDFRGCAFINAGVEYPDPQSPIHQAVLEHRAWFRDTLTDLFTAAGHPSPAHAARRMFLLRDGAMVGGYLEGPEEPVEALHAGVEELLAACAA